MRNDETFHKRRGELAEIGIGLFLKKGVHETSMRDLAKHVGMTAGGLYHYFSSKEDLINLVVDSGIQSVDDLRLYYASLNDTNITESVRACIKYWLLVGGKGQDHLLFYNRETLAIEPSRRSGLMDSVKDCVGFFKGLLCKGIESGEFSIEDPWLVAFNVWALQSEWAMRKWLIRDHCTIDEYADLQSEFIIRQIRNVDIAPQVSEMSVSRHSK